MRVVFLYNFTKRAIFDLINVHMYIAIKLCFKYFFDSTFVNPLVVPLPGAGFLGLGYSPQAGPKPLFVRVFDLECRKTILSFRL